MPESIPFQEPELFRLAMKYSVPAAVNLVLEHYNGVKDDEEDAEESISQLLTDFVYLPLTLALAKLAALVVSVERGSEVYLPLTLVLAKLAALVVSVSSFPTEMHAAHMTTMAQRNYMPLKNQLYSWLSGAHNHFMSDVDMDTIVRDDQVKLSSVSPPPKKDWSDSVQISLLGIAITPAVSKTFR
ncbi:MAG: hypothetical protein BYD32DRAFT_466698 [Podila humilis]|nr:MAG: hypothetical protein BYD32DRAFT_466698 [Podila humilis]